LDFPIQLNDPRARRARTPVRRRTMAAIAVPVPYCTGRELRISSIFSSILLRSAGFSK
jgi:hypothetical protein